MSTGPGPTISVECPSCHKRLKVPADRTGKMAKCPGCMNSFVIGAAGATAAGNLGAAAMYKQSRPAAHANAGTARVSISPMVVTVAVVIVVVAGVMLSLAMGPLRISRKWDAKSATAQEECQDVVLLGIQAYMSRHEMYDPSKGHGQPGLREFAFDFNWFRFSMPEVVKFHGTSTEGDYDGFYHPRTGEIEADAELGGITFNGLSSAYKHGNKLIHITGVRRDGKVDADVDGQPAKIVYWNKNPTD